MEYLYEGISEKEVEAVYKIISKIEDNLKKNMDEYDAVVYGGWACAGGFNYEKMPTASIQMD